MLKEATRESYGKALAEFAEQYDLYVLDADLSEATKTKIFAEKYPERFIECGIAEANMMTVAAEKPCLQVPLQCLRRDALLSR